jgi:hypothetical protein
MGIPSSPLLKGVSKRSGKFFAERSGKAERRVKSEELRVESGE